jgi:hypothetical protein
MEPPPAWTGWLARKVPALHAVIAHGAPVRGETVPGAPLELLLVTRTPVAPERLRPWEGVLRRRTGAGRVRVGGIESYRLGWLRPGVLQQSLAAGCRLLWGDPAVACAIPRQPSDRLDPRLALDEQGVAEAELAAGWGQYAALVAAGALLIARGAYRTSLNERAATLSAVWPEAPPVGDTPPERFVARARELLTDWLFTWEGTGPGAAAVERFLSLRAAARAGSACSAL